jgi:TatD DNase family protein
LALYVDTHAHLDDARFSPDLEAVLERAWEAGVHRIVTVGQDRPTSENAVALARRYPGRVFAAAGIHPHEAKDFRDDSVEWIQRLVEAGGIVAIGETGLDYHHEHSPRDRQKACFEAQLGLAVSVGLPVILHCREAWADCFDLLERYNGNGLRGVAHCFGGGSAEARQLLDLGFLISFAGNLTFPKAGPLRETAGRLPLDRLMIETDCPYLAPQGRRGRRNEPGYVPEVASQLAVLLGVGVEETARVTTETACAFYGIDTPPGPRGG